MLTALHAVMQATMPATTSRATSLPGNLGLPLSSSRIQRSPSMEASVPTLADFTGSLPQ